MRTESTPATAKRKRDTSPCRWVILDENVGVGAQGVVSKVARRDNVQDVYALKRFATPRCRQHEESVLKEVNEQGGHDHIVKPVSYIESGIVFPFYSGGDLFDYVTKAGGVLSEHEVAELMTKIASAVSHLHDKNIAHMDIKPENMLIDSKKQPILCDFGLSYRIPSHGKSYIASGSPQYAAPEMFLEPWFHCRAADVWSIGICAFALCAGRFPASKAVADEICANVKDGSILAFRQQRTFFSTEFLAVLDRCLQIKPEKRPCAKELCQLWTRFLDSSSMPVSDPTTAVPEADSTSAPVSDPATGATDSKEADASAAAERPPPSCPQSE